MTDYISRLNWIEHDGVNIGMINDVLRNRFYDELLKSKVVNRNCIDIGFGTGLLTMMALKHGAHHVTAFESDQDRFELGESIIKHMDLQQRITLLHQRFTHDHLVEYPDHVVFTETVNGSLFQEGLINSLPRAPSSNFLPGTYFLDLHCFPISWDLASGMSQAVLDLRPFSPGVDIDHRFVNYVNFLQQQSTLEPIHQLQPQTFNAGIHQFAYQIHTAWGWSPYLRLARRIQESWSGYVICVETGKIIFWNGDKIQTSAIDFDALELRWRIDLPRSDTPICLAPRAGMRHGSLTMMLDEGHWGPMPYPVLCWGIDAVEIIHDLRTGDLRYQQVSDS